MSLESVLRGAQAFIAFSHDLCKDSWIQNSTLEPDGWHVSFCLPKFFSSNIFLGGGGKRSPF